MLMSNSKLINQARLFALAPLFIGVLAACGGGGASDVIGASSNDQQAQDFNGDSPAAVDSAPAGIPAADKFSLSVTDFAPANAYDTDGITVGFNVIVSDQFGNPVEDGSIVNFVSPESGQIGATCVVASGGCSVTWRSSDPRPADGRVGVLAYMLEGSEAFDDNNGNFILDSADAGTFIDLGEACLDEDEDGVCEAAEGEFFLDLNNDSVINPGDGVWNGQCYDSVDTTAVCNTPDSTVIFESAVITLSTNSFVIQSLGTFPPIESIIDLNDCAVDVYDGLILSDANGNALPTGTTLTFTTSDGAFDFVGQESITVNDRGPTGPFGTSIISNDIQTAGLGRFALVVDFPDGTTEEIFWNTDDSTVNCP